MRGVVASSIMPRTTLDIDASVLRALKRLQRKEKKSLGQLVSELLAGALASERSTPQPESLRWSTQTMGARVDLEDDEAVRAALESR